MKYVKANAIWLETLVKEVQKYVQGEFLYIPNPQGIRKQWGENSGYRQYLCDRNEEIRREFKLGAEIEQLSDRYCLSYDSIKKIVYSKRS
ncbi:CD3324 family protein [Paenibacillus spongiae]|uniref:Mor transcription activator domain-containing protein n=1 Tax=Paenibacillus spongiae TaxID=2909671 RepID=A0ABY5SJZ3_9BACL|nr:CD3324 family protein [Paenibacillus spongiae]UVI32995.1 hypothetical protein L1F29_14670 [Paenibacillus spongiae]